MSLMLPSSYYYRRVIEYQCFYDKYYNFSRIDQPHRVTYFIGYTCSPPLINSRLVVAVALDMQWLAWNNLLFHAWFCL